MSKLSIQLIVLTVSAVVGSANAQVPAPFVGQGSVIQIPLVGDPRESSAVRDGYISKPIPKSQVIAEDETPVLPESPENQAQQRPKIRRAADIPVVVNEQAESAEANLGMITAKPGRQDPDNYPVFRIEKTGKTRECVLSGFERRREVDPSGQETYAGTLPSLRMVSADIVDIPSWHPPESDCIISLSHENKSVGRSVGNTK